MPRVIAAGNGHKANKKDDQEDQKFDLKTRNNATLKVHGLDNLGNTCYLNSVLQVLAKSSELLDMYETAKSVDDTLYYDGQLTDHLLRTLRKINGNDTGAHTNSKIANSNSKTKKKKNRNGNWNAGTINPRRLFSAINEKAPQFIDEFEMHDAHELLVVLLDAIEEEQLGKKNHTLRTKKVIKKKKNKKEKLKSKPGASAKRKVEDSLDINDERMKGEQNRAVKVLFFDSDSYNIDGDYVNYEDGYSMKNYTYWFGSLASCSNNIDCHPSEFYLNPKAMRKSESEHITSVSHSDGEKQTSNRACSTDDNKENQNHDGSSNDHQIDAMSIVCKLFSAGIQRRVICENCGHESQKVDDTCVVSVPLPASNADSKPNKNRDYTASLSQCIDLFSQECFVEGLNCDSCSNKKSDSTKRGARYTNLALCLLFIALQSPKTCGLSIVTLISHEYVCP
uniref:ubiquitinyl hydrolase 1 n=1 Tax=Aplanochytrium stocchinoi TaxID=215587 RepID=A0A7S3V2H4_9STRA